MKGEVSKPLAQTIGRRLLALALRSNAPITATTRGVTGLARDRTSLTVGVGSLAVSLKVSLRLLIGEAHDWVFRDSQGVFDVFRGARAIAPQNNENGSTGAQLDGATN